MAANPPLVVAPDPGEQTERMRLKIGCTIIICAMALVLLTLVVVVRWMHGDNDVVKSNDVVGIVGAVTTFLGTAIGLFFGVSVGQAGKSQADASARSAHATAAQATAAAAQACLTAAQATSNAQTAQSVSRQALSLTQLPQPIPTAMPQALSVAAPSARVQIPARAQLMSYIRALHALIPAPDKPAAAAPLAAALAATRPDAAEIEQIVFDVVTGLLSQIVAVAPAALDVTLTLTDAPHTGYGLAPGHYATLCDDATNSINEQCHAAIVLNTAWRDQHATKSVSTFCADAAHLAAGSPAS